MNNLENVSSLIDFQQRANSFDDSSKWVKSDIINSIPYQYLSCRNTLGDLLDAGGGTGFLPYYLSRRMSASSITIIDSSENMLQKAKERLPQAIIINKSIERYCSQSVQKFDTILARQIFHYVEDVDKIILLLKEKLRIGGLLYVGQFVVPDKESDNWHDEFIKKISPNRKRSFIFKNFTDLFLQQGLKIVECKTTDYEENIQSFYKRRINNISYDFLLQSSKESLNNNIVKSLSIRTDENNLYFTVQFCHLLLAKDENEER